MYPQVKMALLHAFIIEFLLSLSVFGDAHVIDIVADSIATRDIYVIVNVYVHIVLLVLLMSMLLNS